MNQSQYREEWLSAYLDGELSEEQRLIVESRLANDPTARATLEGLNRVRQMVAKLPAWSGPSLNFTVPDTAMNVVGDDSSDDIIPLARSVQSTIGNEFDEVDESLDADSSGPTRGGQSTLSLPDWTPPAPKQRFGSLIWLSAAASLVLVASLLAYAWQPWGTTMVTMVDESSRSFEAKSFAAASQANNVPTEPKLQSTTESMDVANLDFRKDEYRYNTQLQSADSSEVLPKAAENQPDGLHSKLVAPDNLYAIESAGAASEADRIEPGLPNENTLAAIAPADAPRNAPSQLEVSEALESPDTGGISATGGLGGARTAGKSVANPLQSSDNSAVGPSVPATAAMHDPSLAASSMVSPQGDATSATAPPAPMSSEPPNSISLQMWDTKPSNRYADKEASRGNTLRFGRSQVWTDEEIESAMQSASKVLGIARETLQSSRHATGTPLVDSKYSQIPGGVIGAPPAQVPDVQIVMAAIDEQKTKIESVFEELIGQQATAGQAEDFAKEAKLNADADKKPPDSMSRAAIPARPERESSELRSIVLFVTRVEADQIVANLKQRNEIKHNPWFFIPNTSNQFLNNTYNGIGNRGPSAQRGMQNYEGANNAALFPNEKVILILNAPPQ